MFIFQIIKCEMLLNEYIREIDSHRKAFPCLSFVSTSKLIVINDILMETKMSPCHINDLLHEIGFFFKLDAHLHDILTKFVQVSINYNYDYNIVCHNDRNILWT